MSKTKYIIKDNIGNFTITPHMTSVHIEDTYEQNSYEIMIPNYLLFDFIEVLKDIYSSQGDKKIKIKWK